MKTWICGAAGHVPQVVVVLVLGLCCLLFMSAGFARAQSTPTIETLQEQIKALQEQSQAQIKALQEQVDALKAAQEAQAAKTAQAAAAAPAQAPSGSGAGKALISTTNVKVTLGGFIEAAGIYRNRFEGSDVNSTWNLGGGGIPLQNSPNYYMNELRGSARQSRLSILAQGQEDWASLAAYYEMDFLGGGSGTSGNSRESNSYNPRIRQLYATYDTTGGWHLLAGQAWSLVTMGKKGIVARQENPPLTIESQYVPGFTWTRNPQVRLVRDFGSMVSAGLSVEAPQTIVTVGGLTAPAATTVGGGNYSVKLLSGTSNAAYDVSTTNASNMPGSLSLDQYPDIVGKVAFDPGFGHYEVYGVGRFFTDRTLINGSHDNNTTFGWGAGAAALVPVVPKLLDFQVSFLAGQGIGRYGSAQFSDVVVNPITGKLDPLTEVLALAGLVAHPTDRLDIYGYAGFEQASRKAVVGTTGGFGNAAYAPATLLTEGSTASGAPGNGSLVQASAVEQATIGAWYSFYKGGYGLMRVGLSDAYTRLRIFNLPDENANTVMMSLRYYPF